MDDAAYLNCSKFGLVINLERSSRYLDFNDVHAPCQNDIHCQYHHSTVQIPSPPETNCTGGAGTRPMVTYTLLEALRGPA